MDDRLTQIGDEISALETRHELITDESWLSQFSSDVRASYQIEAAELSNRITQKVGEAKNVVESIINDNVAQIQGIVSRYKSTRVDALVDEVGGKDASIPEVLSVLEDQLDVEEFNQLVDIYNKMNSARNQAASTISRARAIQVPNITIPPIAQIIQKAISKLLAGIEGGLTVATSEFSKVREDWPGPKKIRGKFSEQYSGIVKG